MKGKWINKNDNIEKGCWVKMKL